MDDDLIISTLKRVKPDQSTLLATPCGDDAYTTLTTHLKAAA